MRDGICVDQSCTQIVPSSMFQCVSWCQLNFWSAVLQRANGAPCVEAILNRINNETCLQKEPRNHHYLAPQRNLQALLLTGITHQKQNWT